MATPTQADSVVVTLSGKQAPGALADVMRVLGAGDHARLVDFGQLVVRNRLVATALISAPGARDVVKDILFRAHHSDFHVDFNVAGGTRPLSTAAPAAPAAPAGEYVLTVFSPGTVAPAFLAKLTRVLLEHHAAIRGINRLSETADPFMCLEMRIAVRAHAPLAPLQRTLFQLGRSQNHCDMALHRANVSRRAKRMVVFDLSWTLVQCDAINVLLHAADKQPPADAEAQFAEGRLLGPDWMHARVATLKGLDAATVNAKAVAGLKYTPGAVELCKGLKRLGCKLAVVSSGSKDISDAAKAHLGLDFVFGNVLEVDTAGRFTGSVQAPIVDAERKAELVQMLAMQERIDPEQIIAVGDGPVSSKMLACAGMSIAFDQPDATDDVHSGRIGSKSLASVLYLLGVTGADFRMVTTG